MKTYYQLLMQIMTIERNYLLVRANIGIKRSGKCTLGLTQVGLLSNIVVNVLTYDY